MYDELIEKIRIEKEEYGEKVNGPANENDIARLNSECEKSGLIIPEEYLAFLRIINGIEFNGHVHYGIDKQFCDKENLLQDVPGFLEENMTWRENMPEYIFFADYDIGWYCLDIKRNIYVEIDKPSGNIMKEFKSFGQMICESLSSSLK